MKRFALLFSALVLWIPVIGCGSDSGSGGSPTGGMVSRANDPHLPKEVREYEEKNEKRLADQAAKRAAKGGKSTSKAH